MRRVNEAGGADASQIDGVVAVLGRKASRDHDIWKRSWYRVGGPAAVYTECRSRDDLARVSDAVASTGIPVFVLGGGSNLLIADAGYSGLAIHLSGGLGGWTIVEDGREVVVRADAAIPIPTLVDGLAADGIHGLEWAVGIRGQAGGAVAMNAGLAETDPQHTDRFVVSGEVLDLRTGIVDTWRPTDFDFRFRESAIDVHHVVLSVDLKLERADRASCIEEVKFYREDRKRRKHPPQRNAGSVFSTRLAGKKIQDAGAGKERVGCAQVHPDHANFIVTDKDGRSFEDDVFELMCRLREKVYAHSEVALIPETRLLGFTDEQVARLEDPTPGA